MEIRKIIDYVNRGYIASDYLRAPEIYYYMDMVIDDINERLQAKYPNITEWAEFVAEWNAWCGGPNVVPGVGKPNPTEPEPKPPILDIDNIHGDHVPTHTHPINVSPVKPFNPHKSRWELFETPKINRPELLKDNTVYDVIPDEYLRTVLALGVAVKFYTRDEEGEQIAIDYQNRYEQALFKMVRDYHNQVPWYFQDNTGGYIDFTYIEEDGPCDLVPRGVVLRGKDTKVL